MLVHAYDVFDFRLHVDRPLELPAVIDQAPPDLRVSSDAAATANIPAEDACSALVTLPSLVLYACEGGYLLRGRDRATRTPTMEFCVRAHDVFYRVHDPAQHDLVPLWLLGQVMALWLEHRGCPVLHASAVCFGDRAVAFVSHSRAGKSGLAATCMRAGHALLTDDVLAIDPAVGVGMARPGYPMMRMWPDTAAHFVGPPASLTRVQPRSDKRRVRVGPGGFGTFCHHPVPLSRLYLPRRRPSQDRSAGVTIQPVRGGAALVELLRYGFTGPWMKAHAVRARHLRILGDLASRVPVCRLEYPAGYNQLPAVYDAIQRDLAG